MAFNNTIETMTNPESMMVRMNPGPVLRADSEGTIDFANPVALDFFLNFSSVKINTTISNLSNKKTDSLN